MGILSAPDELLGLPFPWNQTSNSIRREYLEFIGTDKATINTALSVMERCLRVASWFPQLEFVHISKQTEQDWLLCADDLAKAIPEMELYSMARIEQVLKSNKVKFITIEKLGQIEHLWMWSIIYYRGYDTIKWCRRTMRNCSDPELVDRYLSIASGYESESIARSNEYHRQKYSQQSAPRRKSFRANPQPFEQDRSAPGGASRDPYETTYDQRPISDLLFKPLAEATPIIAGDKGIPLLAEWSRKEEELRAAQHVQTLEMLGIEPI